MFVKDAVLAGLNPVVVSDRDTLARYAYALSVWAGKADRAGNPAHANRMRRRAYYLRTLAA